MPVNRRLFIPQRNSVVWHVIVALVLLTPSLLKAEDGSPALPRLQASTSATSSGDVFKVDAGDDLQKALDSAEPGDVIVLAAGATFTGPFTLPAKSGNEGGRESRWITVRSSATQPPLPKPGIRVSPDNAPAMAKLTSARGAIVTTRPGASHYQFIGIEFTPEYSATGTFLTELVRLDSHSRERRHRGEDSRPQHFVFSRCYFHGDALVGTRRGIVLNAGSTAVIDSHFSDFKIRGEDSQAIVGWDGPGPYLIRNNYLEAAGENIMFGGGDPSVKNLVPSDITIVENHLAKPLSWRSAGDWTIKNLLELKNARRVLIQGNLIEHNWPQSQNGFAVLFTVRNQDGTAPWSVVEDVTFSNNILRRVGSGINILGHDDIHPSQQTRRILIRNNLFFDIGGDWGEGRLLQLLDGADNVAFMQNTALSTGNVIVAEGRANSGFIFNRNVINHRSYGIVGRDKAPGRSTLDFYFPDFRMTGNIIIGGSSQLYPDGNRFPKNISKAGFVDYQSDDYRMHSPAKQTAGVVFAELCEFLSASDALPYCS